MTDLGLNILNLFKFYLLYYAVFGISAFLQDAIATK